MRRNIGVTENVVSDEPYRFSEPEDKGVLVNCGGRQVFFYLDFTDSRLTVVFPPDGQEKTDPVYGYPVNYAVTAGDALLSAVIDDVDGIELEIDGEPLRYTGVQVTEMLSYMAEPRETERAVLAALFEKIAQNGLDREQFLKWLESAETDLTVPDCYFWSEYLDTLCQNAQFVN